MAARALAQYYQGASGQPSHKARGSRSIRACAADFAILPNPSEALQQVPCNAQVGRCTMVHCDAGCL